MKTPIIPCQRCGQTLVQIGMFCTVCGSKQLSNEEMMKLTLWEQIPYCEKYFPEEVDGRKRLSLIWAGVTGTQHCDTKAAARLRPPDVLILRAENNPYDDKAVSVNTMHERIGWYDRTDRYKDEINAALVEGRPVFAKVLENKILDNGSVYIKIVVARYSKKQN